LPTVIAFLARVGVAPALLLSAMSNRWRQGVSADAALLALPGVDSDNFYRNLARLLGLRFETGPVRFHPSVRWPAANHAGIAETIADDGETHWLVAPRAGNLDALIKAHCRGEIPAGRLAITSPARFSAMVGKARAQVVRQRASLGLPNRIGADFSAMAGPSVAQWMAAIAAMIFVGFAVISGGGAWTALCIIGSIVLAGSILLRLFATAASCEPDPPRAPALTDHQLPVYSIIVALYREAAVVRKLIAALEALDYPRAKLDIKFVVEADDQETRAALNRLQLPARYEIVVAPAGRPRTKPRALNVALDLARGPLLVVFDAEDQPEPSQLRCAAEAFAIAPARVACLQGRLAVDNVEDSWLARGIMAQPPQVFETAGA
jgi:hypothetical protein